MAWRERQFPRVLRLARRFGARARSYDEHARLQRLCAERLAGFIAEAGGLPPEGQLVEIGIERGRSVRKDLKVGICGEHGGEPDSVKFCHRIGMNYVSCSPFRVPIARLAAAQAAVEGKKK